MKLGALIIPLGIATYSFLLLTAASGFLLYKFNVTWLKLKWHIWAGVATIVLGTLHAGIVVYLNR